MTEVGLMSSDTNTANADADGGSEITLINDLTTFLKIYYEDEIARLNQRYPREQTSLVVDWSDVLAYGPDIADDVRKRPEQIQPYINEALRNVDMPSDVGLANVDVRFTNVGSETIDIPDLRGDHVETLVGVSGQVSKTTPILPRLTIAAFRCQRCGSINRIPQPNQGVGSPNNRDCSACERKGPYELDWDQSEHVPHQLIRVKTPPEDGGDEHIDVHLTEDAVGSVEAGQRADVYGIVRTDFGEFESPIPDLYMTGHVVEPHDSDYQGLDIDEHREEIEALADGEEGDPYDLLIDSIAPSISGDQKLRDIKLAIALQLFGGWRRPFGDGRYARGDSHIALIGDPGTGKSSLLDAAEDLNPRSAYTSGKNTTAAGLTAAAVADDFGDSEWSLEAGVIVKAHRGLACVDEIDKVHPDALSSLHSALEKQRVEVNKAGIDASLCAETSLLAAGNPEYGRFDDSIDTAEQLNLGAALASRFDLIFTLTDRPNPDHDEDVAEHILRGRQISGKVARGDLDPEDDDAELIEPAVPKDVLRAWIANAKKRCQPVIEDDDVLDALKDYYIGIRATGADPEAETVPITARKLDAIQRLAEASARIRLSDEVTMVDIERAQRVVGRSLADIGFNEDGVLDSDIQNTGQSAPQRKRVQLILNVLEAANEPIDAADIRKRSTLNCSVERIEHRLHKLQKEGRVVEPDDGQFRLA